MPLQRRSIRPKWRPLQLLQLLTFLFPTLPRLCHLVPPTEQPSLFIGPVTLLPLSPEWLLLVRLVLLARIVLVLLLVIRVRVRVYLHHLVGLPRRPDLSVDVKRCYERLYVMLSFLFPPPPLPP